MILFEQSTNKYQQISSILLDFLHSAPLFIINQSITFLWKNCAKECKFFKNGQLRTIFFCFLHLATLVKKVLLKNYDTTVRFYKLKKWRSLLRDLRIFDRMYFKNPLLIQLELIIFRYLQFNPSAVSSKRTSSFHLSCPSKIIIFLFIYFNRWYLLFYSTYLVISCLLKIRRLSYLNVLLKS